MLSSATLSANDDMELELEGGTATEVKPGRLLISSATSSASAGVPIVNDNPHTVEERLAVAFVAAQRELSLVAMYLGREFRERVTRQLGVLLSPDEWEEGDANLQLSSVKSFARSMALLRPTQRPVLGLSESGNLLSMWKDEASELSFEFFADDRVKWFTSLSSRKTQDRAAGFTTVERLGPILQAHSNPSLIYG